MWDDWSSGDSAACPVRAADPPVPATVAAAAAEEPKAEVAVEEAKPAEPEPEGKTIAVAQEEGSKTVEAIEVTIVPAAGHLPHHRPAAGLDQLLRPRRPLDPGGAVVGVVADDDGVIPGGPGERAAFPDARLHVADARLHGPGVKEAMALLKAAVLWRKSFGIDAYRGANCEGHPGCYNVYSEFQDKDFYEKAFGDDEKRERFLKWRIQLLNAERQPAAAPLQVYNAARSPAAAAPTPARRPASKIQQRPAPPVQVLLVAASSGHAQRTMPRISGFDRPEMQDEATTLLSKAAYVWFERSPGRGTHGDRALMVEALCATFSALRDDICVTYHFPEPCMARFVHPHHQAQAVARHEFEYLGHKIQVRPWRWEENVEQVNMQYHVLLIENAPLFGWNDVVAQQIIGVYLSPPTGKGSCPPLLLLTRDGTRIDITPCEVVYGRPPPAILQVDPKKARTEAAGDLLHSRDEMLAEGRQRLLQAQQLAERYYDGHHREVEFAVGDWVWLRLLHRSTQSLDPRAKCKLGPRYAESYFPP